VEQGTLRGAQPELACADFVQVGFQQVQEVR
jgi:hypothetical protein